MRETITVAEMQMIGYQQFNEEMLK